MTTGIHHITGITRHVQENVDFYAGFLGLRLVKQTGGYEDATQLHLFYGDALGSPGSIVTFLVWEDGAPGRIGHGQVAEIAFAVPPASIGDWLTRAMTARIPFEGPRREFGETVLRLKDPDGIILKLVGVDMPAAAPLPDPIAPTRLRGATIFTEKPGLTADFIARFGYRSAATEGNTRRMLSATDAIDVRDATGYFSGIPGTGVFDHVAFRAADADAVRNMRISLKDSAGITNVHDRKYFLSLYVREPAGTLLEYATDAPGFTVDEAPEALGETLLIPPREAGQAEDLKVMLPQFARPGEPRQRLRELPFVHRFFVPEHPDGSTIMLFHGTGGSEADLMPLAHRANPRATLLGLRGRSTEEGTTRWFRRKGLRAFDQADIRSEARALEAFIGEATAAYGLEPETTTYLGYSNGANFIAAAMVLHPGLIGQAVLLRAGQVLLDPPEADLTAAQALLVAGRDDPFADMAQALATSLQDAGASVERRNIAAGHALTEQDTALVREWLTARRQ